MSIDDDQKQEEDEWAYFYDPQWGWMCTAAKRPRVEEPEGEHKDDGDGKGLQNSKGKSKGKNGAKGIPKGKGKGPKGGCHERGGQHYAR